MRDVLYSDQTPCTCLNTDASRRMQYLLALLLRVLAHAHSRYLGGGAVRADGVGVAHESTVCERVCCVEWRLEHGGRGSGAAVEWATLAAERRWRWLRTRFRRCTSLDLICQKQPLTPSLQARQAPSVTVCAGQSKLRLAWRARFGHRASHTSRIPSASMTNSHAASPRSPLHPRTRLLCTVRAPREHARGNRQRQFCTL